MEKTMQCGMEITTQGLGLRTQGLLVGSLDLVIEEKTYALTRAK